MVVTARGSRPGKQSMTSWLQKDLIMLGFIFGLNARLGRLQYFLITVGVAVLMTGICFVIARQTFQGAASGVPPSIDSLKGPALVVGIIFMAITLTLQSMRIRDIGWDPVCVIPAWIAILIVDKVIAGKIPAWSLTHEHTGTVVGGLVNLGLVLALTFWPSGDYERPFNDAYRTPDGRPPRTPQKTQATSVAAERIARAAGADFGRRMF
jgi:uncharacterized membrane protein YhaH (DUF805 family)